jgi:hypothetical protein
VFYALLEAIQVVPKKLIQHKAKIGSIALILDEMAF